MQTVQESCNRNQPVTGLTISAECSIKMQLMSRGDLTGEVVNIPLGSASEGRLGGNVVKRSLIVIS